VGVVAVAVVEHHVGLGGVLGQPLDVAGPLRQLVLVVAVAEPLLDLMAFPLVRVPVQADHRQVAGGGQHWRDGVLKVNPSGVRSTHAAAVRSAGSA